MGLSVHKAFFTHMTVLPRADATYTRTGISGLHNGRLLELKRARKVLEGWTGGIDVGFHTASTLYNGSC